MEVLRLDHWVLTVKDIERSIRFYHEILGMKPVSFAGGRIALEFGNQKINLHQAGHEVKPHAANPLPGSADMCFITTAQLEEVSTFLAHRGIEILEAGIVNRTGALGAIRSIYIRDPDQNLVEISNYVSL
ncbi:VOC family virulence protein [Chitinophaga caeni]|uniref:VOC family virulence protein n=1 Tax=Chitinophaga caeni TaxID=2029983 RepID=A0A291QXS1_9BACT|nr:VOC family protein [Chitinophaga caeni]ATL48663.1 VOC family virulence protein [Chitinophaga caeni]